MQVNIPKLFKNKDFLKVTREVYLTDIKLYHGTYSTFMKDLREVLENSQYQIECSNTFILAGSLYYDMHYGCMFQFDVCCVYPQYRNNTAVLRAFSKAKKAMVLQSGATKYLNVKHLDSTTRLVQVKEY